MNRYILLISCTTALICNFNLTFGDVFELKDRAGTIEGKVIEETDTRITVKSKTTGTITFPKALIKSVKKGDIPDGELYTKEDIYHIKAKGIDPKDASAYLALAEWCLQNGTADDSLFRMALVHFRTAKELNPSISERASKKLLEAENKEAEKAYAEAEDAFKEGYYLKSERSILSILSMYPDADYANKAKELLIKIWGKELAVKVINEKGDSPVPDVAFTEEEISAVLSHMNSEGQKERYFMKCIDKARDFEERAKDVDSRARQGYHIYAISCYGPVFFSDKPELKNLAKLKVQALIKNFFEDTPVPSNNFNYMVMTGYLNRIEESNLVEKISGKYYKTGEGLYKKAKKSKQPEKGEKARLAYFCFSIANNFSKDEKIKQDAFNYMVESQRLEKALK